jgi:hypothetical protein
MNRKPTKTAETMATKPRRQSAPSSTFVPRTRVGGRLWAIRQRIVASGQRLLDWQDLEAELRLRRGEAAGED